MAASSIHRTVPPGRTRADFLVRVGGSFPDLEGTIEHLLSGSTRPFSGTLQLILLLQDKTNRLNFPQPDTALRSWANGPAGQTAPGGDRKTMGQGEQKKDYPSRGNPTFFVRIQFRQNSTWQGSIQWLEGGSTRHFRSALEMIMLMHEAVAKSGGTADDALVQSWEDEEQKTS